MQSPAAGVEARRQLSMFTHGCRVHRASRALLGIDSIEQDLRVLQTPEDILNLLQKAKIRRARAPCGIRGHLRGVAQLLHGDSNEMQTPGVVHHATAFQRLPHDDGAANDQVVCSRPQAFRTRGRCIGRVLGRRFQKRHGPRETVPELPVGQPAMPTFGLLRKRLAKVAEQRPSGPVQLQQFVNESEPGLDVTQFAQSTARSPQSPHEGAG